ncbi:hypothetical protein BaRGS_00001295 [Batillaria attramentaria]|uniref:Uncharacterized protein n=1 Tax=Batillaria attramentaria TaxID=370345 RepID=A0ABD0M791_9CAEN
MSRCTHFSEVPAVTSEQEIPTIRNIRLRRFSLGEITDISHCSNAIAFTTKKKIEMINASARQHAAQMPRCFRLNMGQQLEMGSIARVFVFRHLHHFVSSYLRANVHSADVTALL